MTIVQQICELFIADVAADNVGTKPRTKRDVARMEKLIRDLKGETVRAMARMRLLERELASLKMQREHAELRQWLQSQLHDARRTAASLRAALRRLENRFAQAKLMERCHVT